MKILSSVVSQMMHYTQCIYSMHYVRLAYELYTVILYRLPPSFCYVIKGIVHPKLKLITHPHVVQTRKIFVYL